MAKTNRCFTNLSRAKGDDLARALAGADIDEVMKANDLQPDPEVWNDPNKNPGMKRMIVGNVLRGRIRRGEYVKVGDQEFNKPN